MGERLHQDIDHIIIDSDLHKECVYEEILHQVESHFLFQVDFGISVKLDLHSKIEVYNEDGPTKEDRTDFIFPRLSIDLPDIDEILETENLSQGYKRKKQLRDLLLLKTRRLLRTNQYKEELDDFIKQIYPYILRKDLEVIWPTIWGDEFVSLLRQQFETNHQFDKFIEEHSSKTYIARSVRESFFRNLNTQTQFDNNVWRCCYCTLKDGISMKLSRRQEFSIYNFKISLSELSPTMHVILQKRKKKLYNVLNLLLLNDLINLIVEYLHLNVFLIQKW